MHLAMNIRIYDSYLYHQQHLLCSSGYPRRYHDTIYGTSRLSGIIFMLTPQQYHDTYASTAHGTDCTWCAFLENQKNISLHTFWFSAKCE